MDTRQAQLDGSQIYLFADELCDLLAAALVNAVLVRDLAKKLDDGQELTDEELSLLPGKVRKARSDISDATSSVDNLYAEVVIF